MHKDYTGRKLMLRLFILLVIVNSGLLRLDSVSSPQPGVLLLSPERSLPGSKSPG